MGLLHEGLFIELIVRTSPLQVLRLLHRPLNVADAVRHTGLYLITQLIDQRDIQHRLLNDLRSMRIVDMYMIKV